jgi:protein Mpv17
MSVLEGTDPREKLRKSFLGAYKANLMLWPWVQAVNFSLVPLEHRVLVVNVVSLGKGSLLSLQYSTIADNDNRVELYFKSDQ